MQTNKNLQNNMGYSCDCPAQHAGLADSDSFFLVGLLSTLERSMQMPMEEILRDLPLAEPVSRGLTGQGIYGKALQCVLAYEDWQLDRARFCQLRPELLSTLYLQSLQWARQTITQLQMNHS